MSAAVIDAAYTVCLAAICPAVAGFAAALFLLIKELRNLRNGGCRRASWRAKRQHGGSRQC